LLVEREEAVREARAAWAEEAAAMRRIRDLLITRHGVDRARLHVRGYWKFGEANHPDHDYGAD
jgi:NADPH-dependent ferric siderophore reductase